MNDTESTTPVDPVGQMNGVGTAPELGAVQFQLDAVTAERDSLNAQMDTAATRLTDLRLQYDRQTERLTETTSLCSATVVERDEIREAQSRQSELIAKLNSELELATAEMVRQRGRANQAVADLDDFKEKVVEVASEYADRHNWCDVIDSALEELGLERPKSAYTFELVITVRGKATRADSRELPSDSWVHDSINRGALERLITGNFSMDNDNTDESVTDVSFEVNDVEED